jgi:glyceraldehyde 3-phosphate dehydrogenase
MRIGLNGFGRIGRAIYRINQKKQYGEIVVINDINPDPNNLAYLLKYDSTYGRFDGTVELEGPHMVVNGSRIRLSHASRIQDVDWAGQGIDLVIDATGVHDNVLGAQDVIRCGVAKVIVTHSPEEVDHTIVFGANEQTYEPDRHHVVSSSICDAVAVAPVLKVVKEAVGIESGFLTTLHPWLAYQNLLDGPSLSWAAPGAIYHHYAIGRSSPGSLIPKPTSAIEATRRVLPDINGTMQCMSFRIPTPTVGAANLYLTLKRETTIQEVRSLFERFEARQRWEIIRNNHEPLVSVDFAGTGYSAVVDHRWSTLSDPRHLYLVLWYDNEWGYSNRVVDLVKFLQPC